MTGPYTNDANVFILPQGARYVEKHIDGLDRRVFRYTGNGNELEFSYWNEWRNQGDHARWYGYMPRALPQSIRDIL